MDRLTTLSRRAKQIYQTEGGIALFRRACAFVVYSLFEYRTYYIYADCLRDLPKLNEAYFMPKIPTFTPKVVSSNKEADDLEAQGFEFRSQVPNARKRLDNETIALCIFVGWELGHIGWLAMTQQGMDSLDEPPYKVDFANGEAVSTGTWTNPKYRRMGLRRYKSFMSRKLALEKGIVVRWAAIRRNNIPSIKSRASPNYPCAEGRYLRILWWKSWKEKTLSQG